MKVLLVEPKYYTQYPPLGLLKLSAYHKAVGDTVEFVRGVRFVSNYPDRVYVTSLFTYSWKPAWEAIGFYKLAYPRAPIYLGGIYASLMPDHAKQSGADLVHGGTIPELDEILPDYSLLPDWKASILFASRGCVRKCSFCAVPRLEPKLKMLGGIRHLIHPDHKKVILWDNNFLATPNWREVLDELSELNLEVDFNQGLDARLVTEEVAVALGRLKISPVRLAYDSGEMRPHLSRAVHLLAEAGFRKRRILVYCLYNYTETPEEFLDRVRDLLEWGVVAYPMRFEPLDSLEKNRHVSPKWTVERLEMIAEARRVIGYGGAFPPYEGLRKKFVNASCFEEAFGLRPMQGRKIESRKRVEKAVDTCWWEEKKDVIPVLVEQEQGTVY